MSNAADPRLITARTEFSNAFADLARGKRNWQLVAFWLLGLLTVIIVAYARLAGSSHVVPYVIEVDRLGQIAAAGPVSAMKDPEPRLVAFSALGLRAGSAHGAACHAARDRRRCHATSLRIH